MNDDLERRKPELQTEVEGGGSGKRPRQTAIASETPEPKSKPLTLTEALKACKLLGLQPKGLTVDSVVDAWKNHIALEIGDDKERTILLNTAKDTLVDFLEEYAEAHFRRRAFEESVFMKAEVRVYWALGGSAGEDWALGFQDKLQRSWDDLATADTSERLRGNKERTPVTEFFLDPSGELLKLRLGHSTGNAKLDQSAIKATENATPYPTPFAKPVWVKATFKIAVPGIDATGL